MTEWWHELAITELNAEQWEALCDGCGKCCLHKFEDVDSREVHYTRVRCRYLDGQSCQCSNYRKRSQLVPDCVRLDPEMVGDLDWLPATCAYRLRASGEPLPDWHYLVSGSRESVHEAGVSTRGWTLSEEHVHPDEFEELVVTWVE